MLLKTADLLQNVKLQEHQQRLADEASEEPIRKLLVHGLGTGKTLSSIAAAEAAGEPYTAVVPASLRPNFQKEYDRFTNKETPADVMSYTALGQGKPVKNTGTLIFDEAARMRNPTTLASRRALELSQKAKNLLLLSGTPVVNNPSDLAMPISMLTGKKMTPDEFIRRYVGDKPVYPSVLHRLAGISPGKEFDIKNEDELKALLKGHVDWYKPNSTAVPVNQEDIHVEMSPDQHQLYQAMWDKLPFYLKWKLKNNFPLSNDELKRATSFLTGPRQVGISTYPYMANKDPIRAFENSPKLTAAFNKLQEKLKDKRTKALIFSNFIDAGLTPYAAALQRANIPHAVFHGGLSDAQRKQLVEDYNSGKLRAALLGPSGSEGLSFKGTQLIQLLDPHWNEARGTQSVGRGLRFDSHGDLPEELRNVHIQRFMSRLPKSFMDRMLNRIGFNREAEPATDEHLMEMAKRKEALNQRFMKLLQEVGEHKKTANKNLFSKEAVGANSRRIAKALEAGAQNQSNRNAVLSRAQIKDLGNAKGPQLAKNVSKVLSVRPNQPEFANVGEQHHTLQRVGSNLGLVTKDFDRARYNTPGWRLSERFRKHTNADYLQQLLSGRHGENRRVYTGEELKNTLPSGVGEQFSYRGSYGKGNPYIGQTDIPGTGLFVSGMPGVAMKFSGIPDISRSIHSTPFNPYLRQFDTKQLRQGGPSGPFTPHYAMDTRQGFNKLFAKLMNLTGMGRVLGGVGAGQPLGYMAHNPQFEAVVTHNPSNVANALRQSYKYIGNGRNGDNLFMKVVDQQPV